MTSSPPARRLAPELRLFGRGPLGLGRAAGGVPLDLGLDRGAGFPKEILVVLHGEVVAGAQQIAALLEVRVHETCHQLVMPLGRVPIGPVLRQLAQHANPPEPWTRRST